MSESDFHTTGQVKYVSTNEGVSRILHPVIFSYGNLVSCTFNSTKTDI